MGSPQIAVRSRLRSANEPFCSIDWCAHVFVQDPTTGEVKPKPSQDDPAKGEDALRSVADESVPQEPHNTPTVGSEREEKIVV